MMNGTRQSLEIRTETPGTEVSVDGGAPRPLPTMLLLHPKVRHTLAFQSPAEKDTAELILNPRVSKWVYGNACFGLWGLGGLVVDFASGGSHRLETAPDASLPWDIRLSYDVDPWRMGTWHLSLAYVIGAQRFSEYAGADEEISPDLALQLVLGRRDWPLEAVLDGYLISAALALDNFAITNLGLRKTFFTESARIHPHLGAGLTLLAHSTQEGGGLPLGFWARAGLDCLVGRRMFLGPYLGYAKYETTTAGRNTGGPTGGLAFGMLW